MPRDSVLLVGNYSPDAQQSMLRFVLALERGMQEAGRSVEVFSPEVYLGWGSTATGIGKWLRYVDKYLVFPIFLRRRLSKGAALVHICDHSNSIYAQVVRRFHTPLVITCHDLGAVRGALGEDTDCSASRMGRLLQTRILRGLSDADAIACDSTATRLDVERLVERRNGTPAAVRTILLGQNSSYTAIGSELASERLKPLLKDRVTTPFVLNVGSSLSRKNREGVLRIFAKVSTEWEGNLVFAGEALNARLVRLAEELGIQDRVIQAVGVADSALEALYNRASALLFPSKFEGFGWPVIEAQACGCPVLCSDAGSLAEVAGDSAFVASWQAEEPFADELLRVIREPERSAFWRARGFENIRRFETSRMVSEYEELYRSLLASEGV